MNTLGIITGFALTIFWVARYILNKEARLQNCTPAEISFTNSLWMLGGSLGIIFLLWQSEFQPFFAQGFNVIKLPLSMSILKGILLYFIVISLAQISKRSISAGVFATTSSLPIGSLVVFVFLNERLSFIDILSVILIGFISVLFFVRGQASSLTHKDRIAYISLILSITLIMMADKISGVNQSWAVHLTVSTFVWLLIGYGKILFNKSEKINLISSISKRPLIIMGLVYLTGEILIIYSMQNIFNGVVVPFIFLRLATPITMIIAAVKYNEGRWQEQTVFGGLILVPVMMSIAL